MKYIVWILFVFIIGCAGGEPEAETIVGDWGVPVDNVCNLVVHLDVDGTYRSAYVCELTDGSYGAVVESGTYTTPTFSWIVFHVVSTSCDTGYDSIDYGYQLVGQNKLTLTLQTTTFFMERLDSEAAIMDAVGVVTIGCFDAVGNFTPQIEKFL